jgi:hypothetical protein
MQHGTNQDINYTCSKFCCLVLGHHVKWKRTSTKFLARCSHMHHHNSDNVWSELFQTNVLRIKWATSFTFVCHIWNWCCIFSTCHTFAFFECLYNLEIKSVTYKMVMLHFYEKVVKKRKTFILLLLLPLYYLTVPMSLGLLPLNACSNQAFFNVWLLRSGSS